MARLRCKLIERAPRSENGNNTMKHDGENTKDESGETTMKHSGENTHQMNGESTPNLVWKITEKLDGITKEKHAMTMLGMEEINCRGERLDTMR